MAVSHSKSLLGKVKNPAYLDLAHPTIRRPIVEADGIFVFLDLDGTLVEIAATPTEVSLNAERRRTLEELTATPDCLVAVVSGRRLGEIQQIVGVRKIFYVGLHGLEAATPQGKKISYPVDRRVIDAFRSIHEKFDGSISEIPGLYLEDKGLTLALHFRLAKKEKASGLLRDFIQTISHYREQGIPLEILKGKEVVEAKPAGFQKGEAAIYLLNRYGKGALPIYLGDDVTDEAAFQSLGPRGVTILVSEAPRPTAATYHLCDPEEVYEFLKNLIRWRRERP